MKLFHRIGSGVSTFFGKKIPQWFSELSLFGKIIAIIAAIPLTIILYHILLIGFGLSFMAFMNSLSDDKPYEFLRSQESIVSMEVVHVPQTLDLYGIPNEEVVDILDEISISQHYADPKSIRVYMKELKNVTAYTWWNDPIPSIRDGTLVLHYSDGSREWICAYGTFYYDASTGKSGKTMFYFSREEFSALLEMMGYHPPVTP